MLWGTSRGCTSTHVGGECLRSHWLAIVVDCERRGFFFAIVSRVECQNIDMLLPSRTRSASIFFFVNAKKRRKRLHGLSTRHTRCGHLAAFGLEPCLYKACVARIDEPLAQYKLAPQARKLIMWPHPKTCSLRQNQCPLPHVANPSPVLIRGMAEF